MSTPAPPLGKNATQLATLQSRPPVNRRLDETAWSTTLSVANGKNRPGTMGLGIWVETLWSDSHRGTNGLAALTAAMCRPFYHVWGRPRSVSAHDEATRAPSSWHLHSSDALWRARTFAQAHCNSQKLAAVHRNYNGQFTHTSSGHRPSPVPARCTPHGQGTCRSGRQDIGPSNSFPRRVPTHRERATRRAPWEGEGQSRR